MNNLTTINWAVTDVPFRKGQEAYIEFGKGCALLNSQGVTQQEIADRYEMSQSQVRNWCSVGRDKRLSSNTTKLPKSEHSLYLLTTLPDDAFEYVVEEFGEKARQIDINAVKAGFDTVEEWEFSKSWDAAIIHNNMIDRHRMVDDWLEAIIEDKERFPDPEPEVKPEPEPKVDWRSLIRAADPKGQPEEFLIEQFRILMYSHNAAGQKAAKAMFSSLYHSDQPKLRTDTELMAQINLAFTTIKENSK